MFKKISLITTSALLLFTLQSNLNANQNSKSSSTKTQKIEKTKASTQTKNSKNSSKTTNQAKTTKVKEKTNTQTNSKNKVVIKKTENKQANKSVKNKVVASKNSKKTRDKIVILSNKKTPSKTIQKQTSTHKYNLEKNNYTSYAFSNNGEKKKAFSEFYNDTKHIKYKMGGTGQNGIDCSAFTQKMFREKFNHVLSRSTATQVHEGIEVKKSDLQPGDLVFFKTSKIDRHVGVYTGNGEFLHASIKGITYTKLDKQFYKDTYWTARRVIN